MSRRPWPGSAKNLPISRHKCAILESRDAQELIAALKERLKKEQDDKAPLTRTVADLQKLQHEKLAEPPSSFDKAEITKLKKRFNQRKVEAEIANLEKEVTKLKKKIAVLMMPKKVYDRNQLLALQVQMNHRKPDKYYSDASTVPLQ